MHLFLRSLLPLLWSAMLWQGPCYIGWAGRKQNNETLITHGGTSGKAFWHFLVMFSCCIHSVASVPVCTAQGGGGSFNSPKIKTVHSSKIPDYFSDFVQVIYLVVQLQDLFSLCQKNGCIFGWSFSHTGTRHHGNPCLYKY